LSPDLELYDPDFYDVIYANGVFVAVGVVLGPVTAIFTSTDGESWHMASIGPDNLPGVFGSIAYGNNTFVAVGTNGSIYMSNDNGNDWNNVSLPKNNNPYLDNNLYAVTYGQRVFVAVGDNGSIWYSNNGTNWALVQPAGSGIEPSSMAFSSVTYGNGVFVAAIGDTGFDLDDKTIWSSTDGVNWQAGVVLNQTPVLATCTLPSILWISLATFLSQQIVIHIRLHAIQNIIQRMGTTGPPCSNRWAVAI